SMNGAISLIVEVDRQRIGRRLATGYLDEAVETLDDALERVAHWTALKTSSGRSIGLLGNAADVLPALVARGVTPDIVTDQTSAHDPLNGYVPNGISLDEAIRLRDLNPGEYVSRARSSMGDHVRAILTLRERGAVAFDYGNNIRAEARK